MTDEKRRHAPPAKEISFSSGRNDSAGSNDRNRRARHRHIGGDVEIILGATAAGLRGVAHAGESAGLVAHEGSLAGDGGGGGIAFTAVFDTEVAVGGGRLGCEPGADFGDAEFHRHRVVARDFSHGVGVEGFGVAA